MLKVDQTICDPIRGNCVTACVASVLELPIEEVPDWADMYTDDDELFEAYTTWLREHGRHSVRVGGRAIEKIKDITPGDQVTMGGTCIDGWYDQCVIIHGMGPREVGHVCVGQITMAGWQLKMWHDPHPSRDGLVSVESIELLVPRYTKDGS
jgi:hypothetical protein